MEESLADGPDSSTQDDVPPLGKTYRHTGSEVRVVSRPDWLANMGG